MSEAERERQTPTFYVFVTALHLCLQPHLRYKQISEPSLLAGTLRKLQLEREKQAGCLCCLADKLKGNNNISSFEMQAWGCRIILRGKLLIQKCCVDRGEF